MRQVTSTSQSLFAAGEQREGSEVPGYEIDRSFYKN